MIIDIWTVMRKEWKELLHLRTHQGKLPIVPLICVLIAVFVVGYSVIPHIGPGVLSSPLVILAAVYLSLLPVTSIIADSFAGERERHTLETLLASRLSDGAILLGKIGAAMSLGFAVGMLVLIVLLVAVNAKSAGSGWHVFPAAIGWGSVGLAFLVAGFGAGVGVLTSLRSTSVKQAQASLVLGMIIIIALPVCVGMALPDEWKTRVGEIVKGFTLTEAILLAAAILFMLDLMLIGAAAARFKRSRLIVFR